MSTKTHRWYPHTEIWTPVPAEMGISVMVSPFSPMMGSDSGRTSSVEATRQRWNAVGWYRSVSYIYKFSFAGS